MTILTTGPSDKRCGAHRRGFTLLELVLVMVVICTVLAMAAPSLSGFFASRRGTDAAGDLVALTHLARSQAVSEGRPHRLNVDGKAGTYWLTAQEAGAFEALHSDFGRVFHFPEGVRADLDVEGADPDRDYVSFFPDGRTEPATITLSGVQGEHVEIRCQSPTESFRIVSGHTGGSS